MEPSPLPKAHSPLGGGKVQRVSHWERSGAHPKALKSAKQTPFLMQFLLFEPSSFALSQQSNGFFQQSPTQSRYSATQPHGEQPQQGSLMEAAVTTCMEQ